MIGVLDFPPKRSVHFWGKGSLSLSLSCLEIHGPRLTTTTGPNASRLTTTTDPEAGTRLSRLTTARLTTGRVHDSRLNPPLPRLTTTTDPGPQ